MEKKGIKLFLLAFLGIFFIGVGLFLFFSKINETENTSNNEIRKIPSGHCQELLANYHWEREDYKGEIASPDYDTFIGAENEKEILDIIVDSPHMPTYAREYGTVTWNCGGEKELCFKTSVINVRTGEIIAHAMPNILGTYTFHQSKLLILNPRYGLEKDGFFVPKTFTQYYKLSDENRLELVCAEPLDPDYDPDNCESNNPMIGYNPSTKEKVEFANPCYIPDGWVPDLGII